MMHFYVVQNRVIKKMVKVFLIQAGNTLGADKQFLQTLGEGATRLDIVLSKEECDVLLAFCPIVSRVGTDVEAAVKLIDSYFPRPQESTDVEASDPLLSSTPPGMVIVLHPTFDPDYVVPDTRRFVPSNFETVDGLFHEGELLDCDCNDNAYRVVSEFLKRHSKQPNPKPKHNNPKPKAKPKTSPDPSMNVCQRFMEDHPYYFLAGLLAVAVICLIIALVLMHSSGLI
ncbi:uncharacterized protein LOC134468651 [Engraulis encrasicolus]|uniref:uncharacterized protein LOC134468651 n=1 Tax=Engraulis encrasicolus TaxID=184585 RepID=UPI002FD2F821